jgi:hypothetical protein
MAATYDTSQMRPDGYPDSRSLQRSADHREAVVGAPPPKSIKARLDRGRAEMLKDAPKRRLCARFLKGDTYWYLTRKQVLTAQSTVTNPDGSGKPAWRVRNTYNFVQPIIKRKVSEATQRIPSYETSPTSTDPEDWGAAKLADKVAVYGYDQWRIRQATVDTVTLALGHGGEGFAYPYFDPNVGPYRPVPNPMTGEIEMVGEGEIKVRTYGRNEVMWEPGCKFDDSRWWAVQQARPIEDLRELEGYYGGPLEPDASTIDVPTDRPTSDQLVVTTEYFERPCPAYTSGRRLLIANDKVICPEEPYPLQDPDGSILDEPVLHRIVWTHDPDGDNDLGLVWQLVDFQRTAQDVYNKLLEYKNRGLHPQLLAKLNSLVRRYTDEPGSVIEWKGDTPPQWANPVGVPESLFRILQQTLDDMRAVAADVQIQADPNVGARTSQAVIENAQAQWQSFLGDLAEWHSRLMRHCLLLVALRYTEPRLLQIRGRTGPENVKDFEGAHLLGQVNVRVLAGSLENRTRQQITNETLAFADRGWIPPQQAMAVIQGGTTESLTASYELDRSKVNRIIQKIRDGSVMDMPARSEQVPAIDPATGGQVMQTQEVPSWMPEPDVDNLDVWQQELADWSKTTDYEQLPAPMQEVAKLIRQGIKDLQAQEAQRTAMLQQQQAQGLGMANASKPTQQAPMPDQRMPNTATPPSPNAPPT